jgi:hypothetical protein
VASENLTGPPIDLTQISVHRQSVGYWNIDWQVQNTGTKALELTSVRLPHGQFKAAEKQFAPPLDLAPGLAARFQTVVHCDEPPGLVTENAFLIFNAMWRTEEWRIFVRVRVVVNAGGEPTAATELVTTQTVGFSGVPD